MCTLLVKRVGFLCSSFVFLVFCVNITKNYKISGDLSCNGINLVILLISVILLVSPFIRMARTIQLICIIITCLLVFYENPKHGLGFIHISLITLMLYSYGLLERFIVIKVVCSIVVIFSIVWISTYSREVSLLNVLPEFLLNIIIVFIGSFSLINEFNIFLKRENRLRKRIRWLSFSLHDSKKNIKRYQGESVNPVSAGLTNAEMVLLENLCLYRESNIDLGIRLKKSPNTVKVQLTRIMIKIGAESRYQLIDLCRNYYIGHEMLCP